MKNKKNFLLWILCSLTVLAVLCSFSIVCYWVREGPDYILNPYLVGSLLKGFFGEINVATYFWISLSATFVLIGSICMFVNNNMLNDNEETIGNHLSSIEQTQVEILQNSREHNQEILNVLRGVNSGYRYVTKELSSLFEAKDKSIDRRMRNMLTSREEKIRNSIDRLGVTIRNQTTELENINNRLVVMEKTILHRPFLSDRDNPEKIRGIGSIIERKLVNIGIRSVGQFIRADPSMIYEKAGVPKKKIKRFQAIAQLLMIPTISEDDAEILVDAGINSRIELADQELVQLSRNIDKIVNNSIDKGKIAKADYPTIEKLSSWIRMARYF